MANDNGKGNGGKAYADIRQEGSGWRVFVRYVGETAPVGSVSLSRVKGNCETPIATLWQHDDHSCVFAKEQDANVFAARVGVDIQAIMDDPTTEWEPNNLQEIAVSK